MHSNNFKKGVLDQMKITTSYFNFEKVFKSILLSLHYYYTKQYILPTPHSFMKKSSIIRNLAKFGQFATQTCVLSDRLML